MSLEDRLKVAREYRNKKDQEIVEKAISNIDKYIRKRTSNISRLEKKLIKAVSEGEGCVILFDIPEKSWWYGWDRLYLDQVSKTVKSINSDLNGMHIRFVPGRVKTRQKGGHVYRIWIDVAYIELRSGAPWFSE